MQATPAKATNVLVTLTISSLQPQQPTLQISAAVVQKVTCDLPLQGAMGVQDLPHIRTLQLADPTFDKPGRVDLLLGCDVWAQIKLLESRLGSDKTPSAWKTIFGWAIFGQFSPKDPSSSHTESSVNHTAIVETTDSQLSRFWEVEETPSSPTNILTPGETEVQKHFLVTHQYLSYSGRYSVTLPRRPGVPQLGESRSQALQRYQANEKAIIRKGNWEAFQAVVQEYLDLGHARLVPTPSHNVSTETYYLPMHGVVKASSTTTKLRVVFDASAKTSNALSLNDTLLTGPTLYPNLDTILLRFRMYPVAVTADISKMYRAVELAEENRDLHRFLWRATPEEPINDYQMTRVTFGVSSSPYLAVRALQQTALDFGHEYPLAKPHMTTSFYVDDLLAGSNTPEKAFLLQQELRALLLRGGFELRKWRSSSTQVLQSLDSSLLEELPVKDLTDDHSSLHPEALGVEWDSLTDTMSTSISLTSTFTPTKRGIISDIAKTFNVLGWIATSIILMKILYQRLWEIKIAWDVEIPMTFQEQHLKWRNQLSLLSTIRLPRCYFLGVTPRTSVQLHGFSDASEKTYAAVVYVRTTYSNHVPIVTLVAAKTKVAPLKELSIPRLELCGATLLFKLLTSIRLALDIPLNDVHTWCDSTIALTWLDGKPRRYRTFVGNRISTILEVLPPAAWHHAPTQDNPADCASRGMLPGKLLQHSLWWNGPPWLTTDPFQMPPQPLLASLSKPELKTITCNVAVPVPSEWIEERYGFYHKLLCINAWCLRFLSNLKCKLQNQPLHLDPYLNTSELQTSEHHLFSRAQARSFNHELYRIRENKSIKTSSTLSSLSPFLGDGGLLRVGGRLSNSNLSHSQKHPPILSGKDNRTSLVFVTMHVALGHCGPSLFLSATGNRMHVVGARRLARTTCKSCITCRKVTAHTEAQMMGQLPHQRVHPSPAFTITGVDNAGPFTLKKGHTRKPVLVKAYIAIFVCFSSKATHIEIVSDLTTEAFLACLRRFVARRGLPQEIHCDNGTNFRGAKNDLNDLYQFLKSNTTLSAINSYLLSQRIQWHCIPERALHFRGLWEAAVKSTKHHLRRIVGTQRLTYEEFSTITTQVESCLNSRPLTTLTSHSVDGISALTPGHFLIGRELRAYPETLITMEPSLLKRWNMCQAMVHHFWQRWSAEYLQQLQRLQK